MWSGLGANVRLPVASSPAVDLFGESPSRVVVSASPGHAPAVELLARAHGLAAERIGVVGGGRLLVELVGAGATGAAEERGSSVADAIDVELGDLTRAWEHGLPRALGWDEPSASLEGR
jgi:phosphoribosylformylglycinamidine synthase